MTAVLAGGLSLLGVVVGALLFGPRSPQPPYLPPIVNAEPPTSAEVPSGLSRESNPASSERPTDD